MTLEPTSVCALPGATRRAKQKLFSEAVSLSFMLSQSILDDAQSVTRNVQWGQCSQVETPVRTTSMQISFPEMTSDTDDLWWFTLIIVETVWVAGLRWPLFNRNIIGILKKQPLLYTWDSYTTKQIKAAIIALYSFDHKKQNSTVFLIGWGDKDDP